MPYITRYVDDVVHLPTGTIISLAHVESMQATSEDDLLIDKLKGDVCIKVTMTSGREHIISTRYITEIKPAFENNKLENIRDEILSRWIYLMREK